MCRTNDQTVNKGFTVTQRCLREVQPSEEQVARPGAKKQSCPLCEKSFTYCCMTAHLREEHNADAHILFVQKSSNAEKTIHCTAAGCAYKGTSKEALKKHIKRVHPESRITRLWPCPVCQSGVPGQVALNEHCREAHGREGCAIETRTFANETEYECWKAEYEKHRIIKWKNNGTSTFNEYKTTHYICNRSGVVRSKGGKSKVVTRYCTSFLKAKIFHNGEVSVKFCGEHVGHNVSAALLPLTEADRQSIGHYLNLGLDVPVVLRIIRKQYTDANHRLYWTSAADVRNARKSLSLQPGRLHEDDMQSLSLRYELGVQEDGFRKFEAPTPGNGGSFRVIIITPDQIELIKRYSYRGISIDDTHCTTRYELKLATMMVVDDYGRGLPAAFLLANKMGKEESGLLFEEVKRVDNSFEPRYFLSDDTMSFWNGFRAVFPKAHTTKLLCSWHCQKAVFDKLSSCFGGKSDERRRKLGGWIKTMFTQSNKVEWHKAKCMLLTLLAEYRREHRGCANFDDYFRRYYLSRQEEWAPYNRTAAIANTTMVSERWHRTLKYTLLNRSSNRRADELVQILISAIPAIAREHIVQDERGIIEGKFRAKENIARHRRAVEEAKNVQLTRLKNGEWTIASFTSPEKLYIITVLRCECESKQMHCSLCGVCPMYVSCSCADAVKSGISCKHAHAWALNYDACDNEESVNCGTPCCDEDVSVIEGSGEEAVIEGLEEVVSLSDKRKELVTELQELVDRLSFSWNTRLAVDENRIASLMRTRDLLLQAADEELGTGALHKPVLIPRRECPKRGRKVLTKQNPVRRMKTQHMQSECAAEYTGNIVADELNICVLCDDTQPPLEDPEDEPIMEGADILWWSCTSCRAWVHRDCMQCRDCPVCDGVFEPTG